MARTLLIAAFGAIALLAACGDSDLERGLSGAAIGGVGAEITGGSAFTGALIGGAAGVLCDDLTPEFCR